MKLTILNKISINPRRQTILVYIILTVITLAVFWPLSQNNFVNIDDPVYVTENIHIQSGITLQGVRWAFSTISAGFWHPLTWLSLMFDYQLYGLNAGGYHLTNLILHILSTLMLFWLFNRMTGSIWRSAFIATFFALHPLRVESVAWIAERKDVLSAFFWMLTLCLYVYYTEKPIIRRYLLVLLSFAFGLMSKSMVVTLPIVMILLDYWPLGRFQLRDSKLSETGISGIIPLWQLKEKITLFILSAFFSIMTMHAKLPATHIPLDFRIANAPVSFVTYLEKTFWPHDLAVFYPFSYQLPVWQVLGASVLILFISSAVIVVMKRFPYLFVGWLWYLITILPVIGIIQVGEFARADRFTYLPSIGIALMLAWSIPRMFQNAGMRSKVLFPAGTAVLVILAVLTWQQCGYWKDSIELFNHTLLVTKDNDLAHNNLATALVERGKNEEAVYHYNKVIHLKQNNAVAYFNRGTAFYNLGRYQMAIQDYKRAIRLKPDYVGAYNNRGG
ncbi:MAG: hypothetical protein H6Q64_2367, partial [Firmicutes bacterium]|nr:hypothetical protein [Bacillota bacterium]